MNKYFYTGFIKRASEYGLPTAEINKILEKFAAGWETDDGYLWDDKPTRVLWNGTRPWMLSAGSLFPGSKEPGNDELKKYYSGGLDKYLKGKNKKLTAEYTDEYGSPHLSHIAHGATPQERKEFIDKLVAGMDNQSFIALGTPGGEIWQKRKNNA